METCFQVIKFIWDHDLNNKLRNDLDNDPVADFGRFGGQAVNRNTGTLSYNFLNDFHLPSSKPPIWLVGINVPDRPIDQTFKQTSWTLNISGGSRLISAIYF